MKKSSIGSLLASRRACVEVRGEALVTARSYPDPPGFGLGSAAEAALAEVRAAARARRVDIARAALALARRDCLPLEILVRRQTDEVRRRDVRGEAEEADEANRMLEARRS